MATVYDKSSLFLAPSGVNDGTVFVQKPVPMYGPEVVTNGDFATDSDWTKQASWSISGGVATYDKLSSGQELRQLMSDIAVGKTIEVKFDILNIEATKKAYFKLDCSGVPESIFPYTLFSEGTYTYRHTITGGFNRLTFTALNSGNGGSFSIDNVSVKEVSNVGDFTFSRGSNLSATRVNADGLIEKGRENIALHSNDFSQSSWGKLNGASVSSTRVADPFGGTEAWELTFATNNDSRIEQQVATVNNTVYAFSVWARVTSGTKIVRIGAVGNLQPKTLTTTWQRIQAYAKETNTSGFPQIRKHNAEGEYTIQIYGFQLELGTVATDYIPTTVATGKAGILENTPRLDYSGGATCPSLLLEPSRTNLITQSEYLNGISWAAKIGTSFDTNTTTSPEGLGNSSLLKENSSNGSHFAYKDFNLTSGSTYTISIFAKSNGANRNLRFGDGGVGWSSGFNGVFNLTDGTATGGTIEPMGSGWYRCSVTGTTNATTSRLIVYSILGTSTSYQGNGTSGLYLYGFQVEQGSYLTSYIPNHSGGSVTRGADVSPAQSYSYSTSNNYTLFFDFNLTDQPFLQNQVSKTIRTQGSSNYTMTWRWFHTGGSHCFVPYFNIDAVYPFSTNIEANRTGNGKVVMSVSGGTYKLFLRFGGTTTMQTTTGKTAAPFNKFNLMQDAQKERINQIVFFDTTLSDTDCEILTGATTYETFEEMALALNYTVYE